MFLNRNVLPQPAHKKKVDDFGISGDKPNDSEACANNLRWTDYCSGYGLLKFCDHLPLTGHSKTFSEKNGGRILKS